MYLLDTNVISELRRNQPHGAVLAWLRGIDDGHLHISPVTIGELQAGVDKTREHHPEKARQIENWLEQVAGTYNVISLDVRIFRCWAKLMHRRSDAQMEDAMIGATAAVHGLTVVTRNTRDFQAFGVKLLDPFKGHSEPAPR